MTSTPDNSQPPTVLTFKKKPASATTTKTATTKTATTKTVAKSRTKAAPKSQANTHAKNSPKPDQSVKASAKKSSKSEHFGRLNLRARVILVLQQVVEGQSLNQILPSAIEQIPVKDKGLFNELVMGTLRHWFALDAQIQPMLSKPLTDHRVHIALLLGLYQLLQTRIPAHAAISETVEAIRQLKLDKASGLVNALLRRTTREMEQIRSVFEAHHALPKWLYQQLQTDWGSQADDIVQQLKQPAPLTLRVNTRQISRDEYLQALHAADIAAQACTLSSVGIQLLQSVQIPELPGYEQGWFSVQDEHAQLCAELLGDLNDKVILDACAAPGGKTAHILEKNNPACLIALDQDAKRLQRVEENLQRLQLNRLEVQIVQADATQWLSEQPLDVILLDAPCTATGVIRRHPDIKLLRQASDVAQTVQLQAKLLEHLWPQLKVGGILLYVTCSILKQENAHQIENFLHQKADKARLLALPSYAGHISQTGLQFFPTVGQADGFYYAKIEKLAN